MARSRRRETRQARRRRNSTVDQPQRRAIQEASEVGSEETTRRYNGSRCVPRIIDGDAPSIDDLNAGLIHAVFLKLRLSRSFRPNKDNTVPTETRMEFSPDMEEFRRVMDIATRHCHASAVQFLEKPNPPPRRPCSRRRPSSTPRRRSTHGM